jgi:hypothetical protein
MSTITHLPNGTMIKADVIESFNKAVENPTNQYQGGGINWDYVDADLNLDLSAFYSAEYLYECFEVLVDKYFDTAYDRLQVLKTDYLGMEA